MGELGGGYAEAYEVVVNRLGTLLCDSDVVGACASGEVSVAGDGVDIVLGTGQHLLGELLQGGHVHGVETPYLEIEEDGLLGSSGVEGQRNSIPPSMSPCLISMKR